jgi:hypothetical protein
MPERDVLKTNLRVRPDDPGQAADPLANDRVLFMGHSGRTLLPLFKRFLDLPYFSPLQTANL